MLWLPEVIQSCNDERPLLLLLPKRPPALGLQGIIFSFAAELGPGPTTAHEASVFEPLRDLWSWGGFLFSRWRWSEGESGVGDYAAWLLIPLVLLLVWRLYSRRHVRRGNGEIRGSVAAPLRPGHDSEFYLIARRLEAEGRGRRPTEPASAWVDRIQAPELRPIVALHYQYRFDPAGLDASARAALRSSAEAWLRDHEDRVPAAPRTG